MLSNSTASVISTFRLLLTFAHNIVCMYIYILYVIDFKINKFQFLLYLITMTFDKSHRYNIDMSDISLEQTVDIVLFTPDLSPQEFSLINDSFTM